MEQIALGTSGRITTRLGFGCSNLMGATSRRDSLRLLEAAYDAGIRHFDVAPRYGYGEAESCLGEFLQHHPGQITITTKYGTLPPKKTALISLGRRIAGPIVKHLPGLKHHLAKTANAATRNPTQPTFTAAEAQASLHRSLTALRTDHIDLWLLHEAAAHDLQDDSLLQLLQSEVKKGTIGGFGIGSSADKIPALLAKRPAYCRTLQYDWSIFSHPITTPETSFRIHHRALTQNFRTLHAALTNNKPLCQRWSVSTNVDLTQPEVLANLLLKAALVQNPASIVLFSSKNPTHIQANVHTAANSMLDEPARQLYQLAQSEPNLLQNLLP
jgi:aryl-alcohol dehydrogenase-like predicted oxidoreductase